MKRYLLIVAAAFVLAACGSQANVSKDDKSSAARAAYKPTVGDLVVAKWTKAGYSEGKIVSIEGARAKLTYGDSTRDVDVVDIYPIPQPGARVDVKVGDWVIAKAGSSTSDKFWPGAQVTSVADGNIGVRVAFDGKTANLPPEKIIPVTGAQAAEFKTVSEEAEFMAKAKAGRPRAPADYKPKTGERVLAELSTNSWWVGTVKAITGSNAKIEWEGPFPPADVAFERIVPYPDAKSGVTPKVNDYLIVMPVSARSSWPYGQVTAVNGQNVEVKLAEGKTRSVKPGEYVPLS
jgi:hypothetical protein